MLQLPYGTTFLPFDETGATVLAPPPFAADACDGSKLVRDAIARPIGSLPLSALARGKRTATVILSDHTRPVPSRDILPAMLEALRKGNPAIEITLLVATGCHRGTTQEELAAKLGPEILHAERIVVHDCDDAAANVDIGALPSGARLVVDRRAVETELLVSEGFIEPHFFAGFSGGRKSVLPGVCARKTVLGNHCSRFIDSPFARTGVLDGNPIEADMAAAARLAKLAFIVNVVIDERHKTVAAFAGDPYLAHRAGCDFLRPRCTVTAAPADIVITTNGGAPLDQNLYQCVKCMTAAEAALREGGVLIVCAECRDGVGGDAFYRSLSASESPAALYREILDTPQESTIPDQWQSQILLRVLLHCRVIFVTRPELAETVRTMQMDYAGTLADAMQKARAIAGQRAAVTVIPNGVSVIVKTTEA